jgi:phosphoinositide-3-kinase regulatory subunit 4
LCVLARNFLIAFSLGNSRFLKSILGRHVSEGFVVLKIFMKPIPGQSMRAHIDILQGCLFGTIGCKCDSYLERKSAFLEIPNTFPYQVVFETDRAIYLLRQYFWNNLYDRLR